MPNLFLRTCEPSSPGLGGDNRFAITQPTFSDVSQPRQVELLENGYMKAHSPPGASSRMKRANKLRRDGRSATAHGKCLTAWGFNDRWLGTRPEPTSKSLSNALVLTHTQDKASRHGIYTEL
jgi:hypothetical protein